MALMMTIAPAARTATDEEQHRGRESGVQQAQVSLKLLILCLSSSTLSFSQSIRDEFEQLSRDRREKMYVWIGVKRFLPFLHIWDCCIVIIIFPTTIYLQANYFHHLQVYGRHLVVAAPDANQWTAPKSWGRSTWGLSSTQLLIKVTTNMIISHHR